MYPNPQDALPLPSRPSLEYYRKQAKSLVRACRSGDPAAVREWAAQWIETLDPRDESGSRLSGPEISRHLDQISQFAYLKLSKAGRHTCALADAQFVIARAHGFASWPRFVKHLEALAARADVSAFEAAARAIVNGDAAALARLLRQHPNLARMRSTREHRATLLHYVSANGVENFRQRTPKNAPAIATMLLEAGAEVDAEADVYGGGATTLGLVATSVHPFRAGVQKELIEVLVRHGARLDHPGAAGNRHALVTGCLANGQPEAAEYVAQLGAPVDFAGAAGIGRVDLLQRFLDVDGPDAARVTDAQLKRGFAWACGYGRLETVLFLLDRGFDPNVELHEQGEGHTALHAAAYRGHAGIVQALLQRGARVDVIDKTWGTPPLIWALTGWSREENDGTRFYEVTSLLVRAGAVVKPELLEWDRIRGDARMLTALRGNRG